MKINRKQTRQIKLIIEELIFKPLDDLCLLSPLFQSSAPFSSFRLCLFPLGFFFTLDMLFSFYSTSGSLIPYETQTETRELHGFNSRLEACREFKCHRTASR